MTAWVRAHQRPLRPHPLLLQRRRPSRRRFRIQTLNQKWPVPQARLPPLAAASLRSTLAQVRAVPTWLVVASVNGIEWRSRLIGTAKHAKRSAQTVASIRTRKKGRACEMCSDLWRGERGVACSVPRASVFFSAPKRKSTQYNNKHILSLSLLFSHSYAFRQSRSYLIVFEFLFLFTNK